VELSRESPPIRVPAVVVRQTQADLAFPVAGIVEHVAVRPGDRVKKDQELARLQPDQAEAQVIQARAALEKAKRDLARVEKLQADRVATLETLQDARTQVEQAGAGLRIAEFNRRHAVIVAPADGVVLRRLAEPNEQVPAARPVLSFAAEADGWIAKAGLAPRDAARVGVGGKAVFQDASGAHAEGRIVRIAEAIDPATLTVTVEASLAAPPSGARSGLAGSVTLTPQPVADRPVVPVSALRDGRGGTASILVVEGENQARRIDVEVEQVDGERAYLRTPLPRTTRVVVAGGQYVPAGGRIHVSDGQAAAAKGSSRPTR
jgi:RND family efflux transporter MFP subunit